MHGADAGQLQALARSCEGAAVTLESCRRRVTAGVHGAPWRGRSADRFREQWDSDHAPAMWHVAAGLRQIAQGLTRQSIEQRQASAADGRSAPLAVCAAPTAVTVTAESWRRETGAGIGGEGRESTDLSLVQSSDGTWTVEVQTGSWFAGSGSDVLGFAALSTPAGLALSRVLSVSGGPQMFGNGVQAVASFRDEAAARRYYEDLKKHASGPMDTLRAEEMDDGNDREQAPGRRCSHREPWSDARRRDRLRFGGTSGLTVGGASNATSMAHGMTEVGPYDSATTVSGSVSVGAGPGGTSAGIDAAIGREVHVVRDSSGAVVKLRITEKTSPLATGSVSAGQLLALMGVQADIDVGASEGVVVQQVVVYDLRGTDVAARLGTVDPTSDLSAAQLGRVHDAVTATETGTRTVQASVVRDRSVGADVLFYDEQRRYGTTEVIQTAADRVPPREARG